MSEPIVQVSSSINVGIEKAENIDDLLFLADKVAYLTGVTPERAAANLSINVGDLAATLINPPEEAHAAVTEKVANVIVGAFLIAARAGVSAEAIGVAVSANIGERIGDSIKQSLNDAMARADLSLVEA